MLKILYYYIVCVKSITNQFQSTLIQKSMIENPSVIINSIQGTADYICVYWRVFIFMYILSVLLYEI